LQAYAENGRFEACIFDKGKAIGTIGFHNYEPGHRCAHIGYWIDRHYEGRGVITKACRVLIGHLFDNLNLNRIQINCNIENARSRAVPERLGFKLEGIQRQAELVQGRFGDWAVYSLLREEWDSSSDQDNNL
jgi:ribosomal-protein-serine acetyltransferase